MKRDVGVVGLGRMGLSICQQLRDKGYRVVGYDISEAALSTFEAAGMVPAGSLEELCRQIRDTRILMYFLPAGAAVDDAIDATLPYLKRADIVLDCGNSHYEDALRRSAALARNGVRFLDVGVSGGIQGARNGACLTIGGPEEVFRILEELFADIAVPRGYSHVGPSGWGHLVKTVHNGIEYGFLQAIGEGLHLLHALAEKDQVTIDLPALCRTWNNGSIIASRLIGDAEEALVFLDNNPDISGQVGGGETGMWAKSLGEAYGVSMPALEAALEYRQLSQSAPDYTGKVIAAIRNVFGGHEFGR